jgi:hypothetical protein
MAANITTVHKSHRSRAVDVIILVMLRWTYFEWKRKA